MIVDDEVVATTSDNVFDDYYLYNLGLFGSSEKILIGCDVCGYSSKASVLFEYFPDYYKYFPDYYAVVLNNEN